MNTQQIKPEQLNTSYYFHDIPQVMKEFVDSCEFVWELMQKHAMLFQSITEQNISSDTQIDPTTTIVGNVTIGKGTIVQHNVRIEGPVYIGKNCRIDHAASIRPGTYLSDRCAIGHGSEIKNSVLFPYAKVSSLASVGDSVLGIHARVASGVMISNRRFDQGEIIISYHDEKYSTGLKHFGCILGDHSRLGANVVTNPGTFIGAHTFVSGLMNIRGFIPSYSFIEFKQELLIMRNRHIGKLKPHGQ